MEDKVVTLTLPSSFTKLLESVHREHGISDLARSNVLNLPSIALDPGETTGVAVFNGDTQIRVYQRETKEIGPSYDWLEQLLEDGIWNDDNTEWAPFYHLRYEDYRIYEWKSADHAWSQVHTLRWIGGILVATHNRGIAHSCCMAQHAKKWWDDPKLKHFGLYPKGMRHGKDALRHLLYYMLFPTKVND